MSDNKLIGKFYEKRGEDMLEVVIDPSGEVIGVSQYEDGVEYRVERISLWVQSVPQLVKLLQKAAGIKTPKVEYEYKVQYMELDSRFRGWTDGGLGKWTDKKTAEDRYTRYSEIEQREAEELGVRTTVYRIIRRPVGAETVYKVEEGYDD